MSVWVDTATQTGVPIIECTACGQRHPETRTHCEGCGRAHLYHRDTCKETKHG